MRSLRFNTKTAISIVPDGRRHGYSQSARARYHRDIRRFTPRLIAEQLADFEDIEPGLPEDEFDEPYPGWLSRDSEPKNLLAEIVGIMRRQNVSRNDVQFVNHATGSMSWAEFASVAGMATFYQDHYSITGLDDCLAIVGSDWWIKPIFADDGEYLGFFQKPQPTPYHVAPSPDLFGARTLLHRAA